MAGVKFTDEKKVYQWLKGHIKGHWTRVENNAGRGFPDVNFCIDGCDGWTELKVVKSKKPPTSLDAIKVRIRPSQFAWLTERARHHGNCSITIGFPSGHLVVVGRDRIQYLMVQGGVQLYKLGPAIEAIPQNAGLVADRLRFKPLKI